MKFGAVLPTCEWGGNPAADLQNTAEHIAALETFISSVR